MCGFVGVLGRPSRAPTEEALRGIVSPMNDTLAHRGPDDHGVWCAPGDALALGHRRLSIIDLSAEGHQPMISACGRWVIAYNGEIYNYRDLRAEIEADGHCFRGHSDTEVLLEAIGRWGVRQALLRSNGMFAMAIWDRKDRELHLARDRVGKKPLYYGWAGDDLVFGSEIKALRAHPEFRGTIDRGALTAYLKYVYVPAPLSIYEGVFKLRAGNVLTLTADDVERHRDVSDLDDRSIAYWSAPAAAEAALDDPFTGSDEEAIDELDRLLRDATSTRMIADVPLGAFLSGGIDSSAVVGVMQAISDRPVRTFSIGFRTDKNEAVHAAAIAAHLGTDHTELYVEGRDTLDVVDLVPDLYDEPFADSSQLPTYLLSKMARRHVTVALSGDGGDELFFGYRRYFRGRKIWNAVRHVPAPLRRALAGGLRGTSSDVEGGAHKLASDIGARTPDEMFLNRVAEWKQPASLVIGGTHRPTMLDEVSSRTKLADPSRRMMLLDLTTYLCDDILVKVDRASMGVSLEVRAPILDYRIVEFSLRLPMSMLYRNGQGKWLLRQVLQRYVPTSLTDRPKAGFGAPIRQWLRGPLKDWGEALLDEDRLEREGFFDPAPIRRMWAEHQSGRKRHPYLWPVLMFQIWLERQAEPRNRLSASSRACGGP